MKNLFLLVMLCTFFACSDDGDPEPVPAENTTITPGQGVGDILFTSDGNAVVAEYGPYDDINANSGPDGVNFAIWYDNGLAFQLDKIDVGSLSLQEIVNMADELVDLNQTVTQMIIMSPFTGETADGIKLGSAKSDVKAVFGEPDKVGSLTEDYDDIKTSFWYSSVDSTLTRMDLKRD